MKIKKHQFKTKEVPTNNVIDHVKNVITPFQMQINKLQIEVLICMNAPEQKTFYANWDIFEFILFNFV